MNAADLETLGLAVGAALKPHRDWTPHQRRVIAAIMVLQECTFAEAACALGQEMENEGAHLWGPPHILGTWATSAGYRIQKARFDAVRRQPIRVVPSHAGWGPLTNVIRCVFDQQENRALHEGRLEARQLGVQIVRQMVKSTRKANLRQVVKGKPIANDNDPDVTVQPHWRNKVQAAWVRRMAARRAIVATHTEVKNA